MPRDFLPSASLATLRRRARLLARVRRFFDERGYWEVETPILSHDVVVDAHLEPFRVPVGGRDMYLQTSPEFGMKRLLAAGADAIYQVTRAFRAGERGAWHNPEFTMVEWYRVGNDHHAQMREVETLIRAAAEESRLSLRERASAGGTAHDVELPAAPFPRTTYAEAFGRALGIDPHQADLAALQQAATARQIAIPPSLRDDDRDGWLNLLLAEVIEPQLGRDGPEFLYDYPASQAALARVRSLSSSGPQPAVAERFELYWRSRELCNGYHELTDPAQLRARIVEQSRLRALEGWGPLPAESRLLAAMDAGLPGCAGVALGLDRVAMLLWGVERIEEVLAFPWERA